MFKKQNKPDAESPRVHAPDGHACCGGGACTPGEDVDAAAHHDPAARVDTLIAERDDAIAKYRYALADFQNYQRRSIENEREAGRQGSTSVLQSIIPVLD